MPTAGVPACASSSEPSGIIVGGTEQCDNLPTDLVSDPPGTEAPRSYDQRMTNSMGEFVVAELAAKLMLGDVLREITRRWGAYEFIDHWQQGEFHHDTIVRVANARAELPGTYLVVATNCNGGVKEVLCLASMPSRGGLWRARCPANSEFEGDLPRVLVRSVTEHWFDPCVLLEPNARSEYRAECRVRQPGGGWMPKT